MEMVGRKAHGRSSPPWLFAIRPSLETDATNLPGFPETRISLAKIKGSHFEFPNTLYK